MPVYCKKCNKPMNPIDAVIGFNKDSKDFICKECTIKEHKKAIGAK